MKTPEQSFLDVKNKLCHHLQEESLSNQKDKTLFENFKEKVQYFLNNIKLHRDYKIFINDYDVSITLFGIPYGIIWIRKGIVYIKMPIINSPELFIDADEAFENFVLNLFAHDVTIENIFQFK